ncbi:MAG: DUF554 domain-containing protein [Clostridiales bacterium]|nr:DUF554 domain-containing protein [Clostridiales bacterium]
MLGVMVNTLAIIAGSSLGLFFRKGLSERISKAVMAAIGLSVIYLGITGMMAGKQALVVILSLVLGAALGTVLDIDGRIKRLGQFAESKLNHPLADGPSIGEGFVTASLLFCVGSMAIIGSLNAGLSGDNTILFAKSVLDFISSAMLSLSLGVGVLLSAGLVLLYQGFIVLLSQVLRPLLSAAAISEMSSVGSILIFVLGLNLLQITKIKIADFLPAIVFALLLTSLSSLF